VVAAAAFGHTRGVTAIDLDAKVDALRRDLLRLERVVVAFSGGADSSLLAAVATETLGAEATLAVTAVSPSLATAELDDCRRLSAEWGMRWQPVATEELERAAYRVNDGDRCYHCKSALMDVLAPLAAADGATVVLGVNTDDLDDHRPGQRAAEESGAEFPLVAAGFSKDDVRAASRRLGLRTWDKPAAACLASRIPTGTAVTVELLSTIDRAEAAMRALGFRQLRVRHHGETARIEVDVDDLELAVAKRHDIVATMRRLGYHYVTLDLEGFRSGSTNGTTHQYVRRP
jgi:pyridinium-3,5-biscarboxylic acid mononucleotide sulfurtransferase